MHDLERVTRGVWRPADQVSSLAGRAAALLQACPDGTVLAGWTAACLHGLWLPPRPEPPVEVIVHPDNPLQRQRSYSRRGELRARRQALEPDETTVVCGLPVTTEARTWLDLAPRLSPPDLVAVGDSALRGDAERAEIERLLRRARHRRGVVLARTVLPLLNERARSRPESHLRYALVSSGLPEPQVNVAIYSDDGEWLAEPDLSYDDVRLALEYNGSDHADPARMRRDITRDFDVNWRGGWRIVTVGPAEVFRRPDTIATYVRSLRRTLPRRPTG